MALGYAGVHQLVLPILDGLRRLPEPQHEALDAVLGRSHRDPVDPFLVGLAVLSLVADAAGAQPVLVVIDDAQWLDDESALALSFVGRRLWAERVAMVVALRDTPDTSGRFEHLRRLDLVGLGDPEALQLLAESARAPVDPTVATHIAAATRGNPLALVELPAALTVEQLRGAAPLPDPLPIGDRLSGLFASRARVLDADARMVLLLAAAERLGDPALLRRAAEIAGELSWDEAVARAEASGLVTFAPTVEFRHPLVRSAVYYSAAAADRRRAHAALAGALDTDIDADRRAWHLGAAAAGPDERVARALEASAERARRRGGASAAAAYLWRAFELTPEREHAAERLLEAARAELTAGHGPQARALLERARASGLASDRQAGDAQTAGRTLRGLVHHRVVGVVAVAVAAGAPAHVVRADRLAHRGACTEDGNENQRRPAGVRLSCGDRVTRFVDRGGHLTSVHGTVRLDRHAPGAEVDGDMQDAVELGELLGHGGDAVSAGHSVERVGARGAH
jgi:hypothetical protein